MEPRTDGTGKVPPPPRLKTQQQRRASRRASGAFVGLSGQAQTESEALLAEFLRECKQSCANVFGLAFFISAYCWALLGRGLLSLSIVLHLGVTAVGLAIFGVGLRQGLMPLGELVGAGLPQKVSRCAVFLSVFCLGILCAVAEPAIGALKVAGMNRDPKKAPLLSLILDSPFSLAVMVGVGVGSAAVVGCLRLIWDLKFKWCLFSTCIPALVVSLSFIAAGKNFERVTGLAWDCGAVTTGPITVPIVLAVGIGVAASSKQPDHMPSQACENARRKMRRNTLLSAIDPVTDGPRPELPRRGEEHQPTDLSGFGIVSLASLFPVLSVWGMCFIVSGKPAKVEAPESFDKGAGEPMLLWAAAAGTARAVVPLVGFLLALQLGLVREPLPKPRVMIQGLTFCVVGMLLFCLGLTGALTPLGDGAGRALHRAIDLYGSFWGPPVILIFGFLAGMGATFAEPAVAALGETVERLTRGSVPRGRLVMAAAHGVGMGIMLGMAKIYFKIPLWTILAPGYGVCLVLTHFSSEEVACIAWDSAGVTTGPVTVSIVLASGLALGDQVGVSEGFGLLSCASVGPILSVLIMGLLDADRRHRGSVGDPGCQELTRIRQRRWSDPLLRQLQPAQLQQPPPSPKREAAGQAGGELLDVVGSRPADSDPPRATHGPQKAELETSPVPVG